MVVPQTVNLLCVGSTPTPPTDINLDLCNFCKSCIIINQLKTGLTMRIFTRVMGRLAVWEVPQDVTYDEAVALVRAECGPQHKEAILALVKY